MVFAGIVGIMLGWWGSWFYHSPRNARMFREGPAMVQALRDAKQFIENGVEFGYIRMPDAETPDSAHNTLPAICAILARIDEEA